METIMELKDQKHKVSYSIGVDIGRGLQKSGADVDIDVIARGMKDLLAGGALLMTDEEMKTVFMQVKTENAAKQQAKQEA
jgi:FKBP-type peptidyl-prolyl cis-trans isomerase FklB